MNHIEVNVQTGEVKAVPFTQVEIDLVLARKAEAEAQPAVKLPMELLAERVATLEAKVRP